MTRLLKDGDGGLITCKKSALLVLVVTCSKTLPNVTRFSKDLDGGLITAFTGKKWSY